MSTQRRAFALKALTEIVKEEKISEFSVITKRLNDKLTANQLEPYTKASFYRFLDELHISKRAIDEYGTKYYMFDEVIAYKTSKLTYRSYNNKLYYTVNPCHAALIAELLNQEFDQQIFNAVPIGNMIICFFHSVKDPDKDPENLEISYLTRKHLKKKIPSIIAQSPYYSIESD